VKQICEHSFTTYPLEGGPEDPTKLHLRGCWKCNFEMKEDEFTYRVDKTTGMATYMDLGPERNKCSILPI
jgi:hypothetical protein